MKILIAVPCMDMVHTQFVMSLMAMDKPEGTDVHFHPGSLVYDSRNIMSLYAIKNGYTHVMWLDSDMIVPKDTIQRMLNVMGDRMTNFVTGLYVKRTYPTEPVLYSMLLPPQENADGILEKRIKTFKTYPQDERFIVAGCGMGCAMTSVDLLKRVWDKHGMAFTPYPWAGEDQSFCYRVLQLGEYIWCDSSISCGHVGSFIYSEKLLKD